MSIVYIKFEDREAEAQGVEELAQHARVVGYPGWVYSVRTEDLRCLDSSRLPYRRATEDEVESARGSVRHTASTLL